MRFPRYWAKGRATLDLGARHPHSGAPLDQFECWGWSDVSVEDARRKGSERADAVAERVLAGDRPDRYTYGDRPVREPVLEEWTGGDGSRLAVSSRNSYGCIVLNTADVMFVDVDLDFGEGLIQSVKRLFGRGGPTPRERGEAEALGRLQAAAAGRRDFAVRVYRTRGGLRYLMTHRRMDPTAEATRELMRALGADPLYLRLCKTQECFRARLTPKPWRCGMPALAVGYPWRDQEAEAAAKRWVERYSEVAGRFATCSLVTQVGSSEPADPEIRRVVEFHDRIAGVGSELPLA